VLAQDAVSVDHFGYLVGALGRMLIMPQDVGRMGFATLCALHNPGVDYPLSDMLLSTKDGQMRMYTNIRLLGDPESCWLVFSGNV
jgi:hypothetical protein